MATICILNSRKVNFMRIILSVFLLVSMSGLAQVPALIPYQAIARDSIGQPLANYTLNARYSMHDLTMDGEVVWQELQTVSTSALGLFTTQLGSIVPLTNVDWISGAKFMEVEIDLGNGFVEVGNQQILSVPYALNSGNGINRISDVRDSLFLGNGEFLIIPGISAVNSDGYEYASGQHNCGYEKIHNPIINYGSLVDQAGNYYKTILIGNQEWMAENLKTDIYRNGDTIPTNLTLAAWQAATTGAYTWYFNSPNFECPYGKLYNWYTTIDSRGLCPSGWHVPTTPDWDLLFTNFGSNMSAGGPMKSAGTLDANTGPWASPNTNGTNYSGFSGVPGGYRNMSGGYEHLGNYGYWWSATEMNETKGNFIILGYNLDYAGDVNGYQKYCGISVRCVRD